MAERISKTFQQLGVFRFARNRGVALFIAVFALLIISGVAMALLLMAGMESALAGNYRSITHSFYAALAGLEEGRGRLWPGHPNAFGNFVAAPNTTFAVGQVRYILNPSAGEVVQPTNLSSSNAYADTEYQQEFGVPVTSALVQTTASVSTAAYPSVPGPLFKWVRITAKTERAGGVDINGDGILDNTIPVFFDGSNQNLTFTGKQVFRITALAVEPNGSRRILQYDAVAAIPNLAFPSAITLNGPSSTLSAANSNVYAVSGSDNATCGTALQAARPAIGVILAQDVTNVTNAIPSNRRNKYTGSTPAPSVANVAASLSTNMQSVSGLQSIVAGLTANADQVVAGPASGLSNYGTSSKPTITVVNGDLTLSGNVTGTGILIVTGNFVASGNVGWNGIVLVIGKGTMTVNGGGNSSYNGVVFLAKTLDAAGNPLASLGPAVLNWSGGGGNGVFYDSCALNNAQSNVTYRVLSFREVVQ